MLGLPGHLMGAMTTVLGPRDLPELSLWGWQDAGPALLWDPQLSSLNVLPGLMAREKGQWVWSVPLLGFCGVGGEGESHAQSRGHAFKTKDRKDWGLNSPFPDSAFMSSLNFIFMCIIYLTTYLLFNIFLLTLDHNPIRTGTLLPVIYHQVLEQDAGRADTWCSTLSFWVTWGVGGRVSSEVESQHAVTESVK